MFRVTMKGPGKGSYHDTLESITRLKVIHKLTIKPHSYELLRNETKIHRNRLRALLDYFTEKKAVIPHKYNFINTTVNGHESTKIKTGLEYYILNLDNKESRIYLRDIKNDSLIKLLTVIEKTKFILYERELRHLKRKRQSSDWLKKPQEKYYNRRIQLIKAARNTDPSFSVFPYLLPEQKEEYTKEEYSVFPGLKESNSEMYLKYMQILDQEKTKHDNNNHLPLCKKLKEIKDEQIKNLLIYCDIRRLSQYDLLIYLSWSFPSRENYIKYWNTIKKSSTKTQ